MIPRTALDCLVHGRERSILYTALNETMAVEVACFVHLAIAKVLG